MDFQLNRVNVRGLLNFSMILNRLGGPMDGGDSRPRERAVIVIVFLYQFNRCCES